jgi:methylated-DNA-[protein]-cysteine S-methyltransferase
MTRREFSPSLRRQLCDYAAGHLVDFHGIRLDLVDLTDFQRRVLSACRQIAYGTTLTYAQLAQRAKAPTAARAVGQVMARNPVPLIIPCHRVVARAGGLGGFSAPRGLTMKRRLLRLEGAQIAPAGYLS